MEVSLVHFRKVVDEIQANSWWRDNFSQRPLDPIRFTYRWIPQGESITEVPNEPFESLLLRVRRLMMHGSAEKLLRVHNELKRIAQNEVQKKILEAWHKYWRIAFIKEPYFLEVQGVRQIMTPLKVFDAFVNGQLFHSNSHEYNIILHGHEEPVQLRDPWIYLQMEFHAVVLDICLAALGLAVYLDSLSKEGIEISGQIQGVTDFIWCRNQLDQMDEQYKIFNDWINDNGGCKKCRWE